MESDQKTQQGANANHHDGIPNLVVQIGTKEEIKAFIAYLDDLQKKIYEAHRQPTQADELITAETIRDKFLGKSEKPRLLIEIFNEHHKRMETLIDKEYSRGTLTCFQTSLKHTKDFLKWKYNLTDIACLNFY